MIFALTAEGLCCDSLWQCLLKPVELLLSDAIRQDWILLAQ
jgi:hypothetical protein